MELRLKQYTKSGLCNSCGHTGYVLEDWGRGKPCKCISGVLASLEPAKVRAKIAMFFLMEKLEKERVAEEGEAHYDGDGLSVRFSSSGSCSL